MLNKLLKLLKIRFSGELLLKDGTPIIVSGDLAVGVQVQVNGPDGVMDLPDGSYELEGGDIITVQAGVVTDIVSQVETPEAPDVEIEIPIEEAEVPVETPSETPTEDVVVEDPMKKMEEVMKKLSDLEAKIAELETDIETIMTKTNFSKEISKTKTPELELSSNVNTQMINRIKELKNNKK